MQRLSALEFFSGIGAFSHACTSRGISVVRAFDQNEYANRVFAVNYGQRPHSRNLDTITASDISDTDIWWMSPPCKPYSVRGKRLDDADSRAQSLKNLIDILPSCCPKVLLLENVQ